MLKYSVFLGNVGGCFDRYCPKYDRDYSIDELFSRVAEIPELSAVDLVMTQDFIANKQKLKSNLEKYSLKVGSVAVDTFVNPIYKKGSFSSTDESVRAQAITDAKAAMDFAAELSCNIVTIWPGQDGYDYIFAADYIKERQLFTDAIKELCAYRDDITITLEYKIKEPRTHSYISTVGTTLLMINEIGTENIGIALDYGHAALGYETPAESVAVCKMYGDRLKHIHINDNYRLWDDDMIVGTVHSLEFLEFFYWLSKTGYNGYLVIDQFPYRENGREAVRESAKWLDALQKLFESADVKYIEETIKKRDGVSSSKLMRKLLLGAE